MNGLIPFERRIGQITETITAANKHWKELQATLPRNCKLSTVFQDFFGVVEI